MSANRNTRRHVCPLCQQDALAGTPGRQRSERAQNLRAALAEIRAGRRSVRRLSGSVTQMCANCQMLMLGISSNLDQPELEARMERSIRELEEMAREPAA